MRRRRVIVSVWLMSALFCLRFLHVNFTAQTFGGVQSIGQKFALGKLSFDRSKQQLKVRAYTLNNSPFLKIVILPTLSGTLKCEAEA